MSDYLTGLAVVKFGAEWCTPCKVIEKSFAELAERRRARSGDPMEGIKFVMVDVDKDPEATKLYGVRAVPTTMVFVEGKIMATKLGAMSTTALEKWIGESVKP